jgi:hypothetical protein
MPAPRRPQSQLVGKGVSREKMLEFEHAVRTSSFLLITSGTLPQLAKARPRVESTGARVTVYTP